VLSNARARGASEAALPVASFISSARGRETLGASRCRNSSTCYLEPVLISAGPGIP